MPVETRGSQMEQRLLPERQRPFGAGSPLLQAHRRRSRWRGSGPTIEQRGRSAYLRKGYGSTYYVLAHEGGEKSRRMVRTRCACTTAEIPRLTDLLGSQLHCGTNPSRCELVDRLERHRAWRCVNRLQSLHRLRIADKRGQISWKLAAIDP